MKSLVKIAIHGLALVGATEIYKEYRSRKNFDAALDSLTKDTSDVHKVTTL